MTSDMTKARSLTITFLTPVSFASLNGGDKEAENISSIKKISRGEEQFPYVSSQAVRRALRDQLAVLGHELSEAAASEVAKGAATTKCDPETYIDDDLFGFMRTTEAKGDAKGTTDKRTSPVRVSPLLAVDPYVGDLDFGTNYMGVDAGGTPNIYETEIHSGLYRGSVLIELDRVGCGDGFGADLGPDQRAARVRSFINALQNLWSSGRQTRFLADLSPKFVAAAFMTTKNPIFLEALALKEDRVDLSRVAEVLEDFAAYTPLAVLGGRSELVPQDKTPDLAVLSLGRAFDAIRVGIAAVYGVKSNEEAR